jgi:gluconate kinase
MSAWQQERHNHVMPMYEFTSQLATLEPPPPEMQQLLAAVRGNQEAMDGFVSVVSGAVSPTDFFSEENVTRILAEAGQLVG